MILTNVVLENFKKHKHLTVDLTKGLNTIHGPNYSGKSTIQQAIAYALFGTAAIPGKGIDIPTKGTESKPKVVLNFESKGKDFILMRSGSETSLADDESGVVSRSASAVNKYIEDLMGLTKDQFFRTRVSKQGDAHALLSTGTQELKKLVEILSGCVIVDKIAKRATIEVKIASDKEDALVSTIDETITLPSLKVVVAAFEDENSEYLDLKNKYESLRTIAQATLRKATDSLTKAKRLHQTYCDAFGEQVEVRVRFDDLTKEYSELSTASDIQSDNFMVALSLRVVDMRLKAEEYAANKLEYKSLMYSHERSTDEMTKAKTSLDKFKGLELYSRKDDIDAAKKDSDSLLISINLDKKTLSELVTLVEGGVCAACNRPLGEMTDEEVANHKADIQRLSNQINDLTSEYRAAEKVVSGLISLQTDFLNISTKIESKEERIKELMDQLSVVDNSLVELGFDTDNPPDTEAYTEAVELNKKHVDANKMADACGFKLAKATEAYDALVELTKPALKSFETAREAADTNLQTANTKLFQLMDDKGMVPSKLSEAKAKYEQYSHVHQKVADLNKDSSGYKAITKVIKENRSLMMAGVWAGLLEEASNFVVACTSGDVTAVDVDDKFNLTYIEDGFVHPIDAASGAQKSLIGLGIRLAISNMLPSNVGFIMVDEVTADMTNDISAIAMSVMRTKCSQTIAISHREQDLTASDNVISL